MSINPNCKIRNTYSKWLFAALLILSFFTFSGFTSQTQSNSNKPKTTLITTSNLQLEKSISYKRALKPAQPKYLSFSSLINANRLYTQQVKVRITELNVTDLRLQTGLFYKPKTTSSNADDDSALILA